MKTTTLFLRLIIALLISIVYIDSHAQKKTNGNYSSKALQQVMARENAKFTRQLHEMERQNQERQRKNYTPVTNLVAFHPSKELLEFHYNRANNCIAVGDTIVGIKMLYNVANLGLRDAQYDYGYYCTQGKYVKKDITKGIHFIQEAAKQNHPDALYYLGVAYYYGYEGFRKDSIESINWLEKSAQKGFLQGQVALGNLYFNAKDTLNAIKYWKMANDNPNIFEMTEDLVSLAQSAYNVGWLYYFGQGIEKNESKGVEYLKKAAKYGHSYSAYSLGLLYREGTEWTPQSDQLACAYIEQSALLGYPEGEAVYGDYCQFGIGKERDSLQSINWYKRAYQDGYTQAAYPLAWHYANTEENDSIIAWGTKPECCDSVDIQYSVGAAFYYNQDYDNAEIWWKKAASQKLPEAFWGLYVISEIVKNDSVAGFEYLKQAANLGYPYALNDMGYNYLTGYIVNKNVEKARDYFHMASEMGNALAFNNLGLSYCDKAYIKKVDWKTAADYFRKGAEMNSHEAQYNYAICLKKGKGVKKDKQTAIHWLKLASQNGDENAANELEKLGINNL